jgi:uncharacterized protein YbbK (DUF523 family)
LIKLGISACLLGKRVRYDGGDKLDSALIDALGGHVEFVPVCPEVGCGLGVPREPMRLIGDPDSPRLVTRETNIDHTGRMTEWSVKKLDELEREKLCGCVFKGRSPSCGMAGVDVYDEKGRNIGKGRGLFAAAFIKRFPALPVEDEKGLQEDKLLENFIEQIRAYRK